MSETNEQHTIPGFKHGFYLILASLAITLFAGLIGMAIIKIFPGFQPWNILLTFVITFGATYFLATKMWNDDVIEKRKTPFGIFVLLLPATIGMAIFSEGIVTLVPMPQVVADYFASMVKFDLPSYLTVAVAAPILEELIFRGVILKAFLKRYNATKAIVLAATLFAIAHLNPWQGIAAFIAGIVIGWVYYKTKSIWPAIFIHFVNNSFSFYIGYKYNDINTSFYEISGGFMNYAVLLLGSLLTIYIVYKILDNLFLKLNTEEQASAKNVY